MGSDKWEMVVPRSKRLKIGFASNDWSRSLRDTNNKLVMGGSGHIRIGQYVPELKKLGVDCALGILAFDNKRKLFGVHTWDKGDHFDCDVVVMQRYMHKDALRDMKEAIKNGQIIINDVDDWYWGLSPLNAAHRLSDPKNNPNENIEHYKEMIKNSTGVITSTPFLTEKMTKWNKNCVMHQNYVQMSTFKKRDHIRHDSGTPVVGWMGSTSHRSGDLHILRGLSSQISKMATWHHTGHIDIVGVPKFWDEIKVEAGMVTTTPFLPPTELGKGVNFDIGLVPLTSIHFNDAKSWIKGIEYAAAGVPFVASSSAEYRRLHEEYGIGILARRDGDFPKKIKNLLDAKVRQEIADENYELVKQLDVTVGAKNLLAAIESFIP